MRRLVLLIPLRMLVAFLAVQVADTPLFCGDELPTEAPANASRYAAPASDDLYTMSAKTSAAASCFCPCHLTFQSEGSFAFAATTRRIANVLLSAPSAPAAPPQSLDHPPQNLG